MKQKFIVAALLTVAGTFGASDSQPEALKRIHEASVVFNEVMSGKDSGIPKDLLDRAHCAVIIPGLKQGAFIVGAKFGKGVIMCRKANGGWRGPATVKVEGGSFGLQAGGGETDLILLVMNERGAEKLLRSEFKVGGEASVMAGPVGRTATAETDAYMRAEMLGYSRSRGVFAGIALQGSTLREDHSDNETIYGRKVSNEEILMGKAIPPAKSPSQELAATLNRYSTWEKK